MFQVEETESKSLVQGFLSGQKGSQEHMARGEERGTEAGLGPAARGRRDHLGGYPIGL